VSKFTRDVLNVAKSNSSLKTGISFQIPVYLKSDIDLILKIHDITLTSFFVSLATVFLDDYKKGNKNILLDSDDCQGHSEVDARRVARSLGASKTKN